MEKSSRYVDNGDGTVTDNTTGLVWTKDANHGLMSWFEAVKHCEDFNFAGHSDWRLPLVAKNGGTAELDTLFRKNGDHSEAWEGTRGTPFTNVQSNYYWSGTSYAHVPGDAWGVDMGDGDMGDGAAKTCRYDVWPVRDGWNEKMTPREVLHGLVRGSETLARDPLVSGQIRNRLLGFARNIKVCVEAEGLNTNEVCNLIEDLYWEVDKIRNDHPKLTKTNPAVFKLADNAKEYVMKMTGCLHYPNGKMIGSSESMDSGLAEFLRRKQP